MYLNSFQFEEHNNKMLFLTVLLILKRDAKEIRLWKNLGILAEKTTEHIPIINHAKVSTAMDYLYISLYVLFYLLIYNLYIKELSKIIRQYLILYITYVYCIDYNVFSLFSKKRSAFDSGQFDVFAMYIIRSFIYKL